MNEVKFPEGIIVKKPHSNAPEFVKGKLSIKRDEFIEWLKKQPEWVNLDIKESKKGNWYLAVDDWKPESKESNEPAKDDSGLPF